MATFSKREALRFGWETVKKNLRLILGLVLVSGVVYYLPSVVQALVGEIDEAASGAVSALITIVFWPLQVAVSLGWMKIGLQFVDGKPSTVNDLFSLWRSFFKYLIGGLVYALIVTGGFILLIVPGIIWAVKFQFWPYLLIDKNLGPIEAIKASGKITQGVKWNLFLFGWLLFFVNLLGILALLLGLLVTVPVTMLASAFVYRKLLSQTPQVK
jgi:uncharacterized membrane protein